MNYFYHDSQNDFLNVRRFISQKAENDFIEIGMDYTVENNPVVSYQRHYNKPPQITPVEGDNAKVIWDPKSKHGTFTAHYPNGQLESRITYQNGKKHGTAEKFSSAGVRLELKEIRDDNDIFTVGWNENKEMTHQYLALDDGKLPFLKLLPLNGSYFGNQIKLSRGQTSIIETLNVGYDWRSLAKPGQRRTRPAFRKNNGDTASLVLSDGTSPKNIKRFEQSRDLVLANLGYTPDNIEQFKIKMT